MKRSPFSPRKGWVRLRRTCPSCGREYSTRIGARVLEKARHDAPCPKCVKAEANKWHQEQRDEARWRRNEEDRASRFDRSMEAEFERRLRGE